MDELHKQVRRASRLLGFQRFVAALGWCWTGALLGAVILIFLGKFWPLGVADWIWGAAALGLGALAAASWAFLRGGGPLDAAIEIDHRFGLKERVSSSLSLAPDERDTAAGRALVEDAVGRVRRIEVAERMKVVPGRPLLFPLVPALVGLLVAFLVNPAAVDNQAEANTDAAAAQKQVRQSVEKFEKRIEKKRAEARKQGLKEAEKVFKLLQEGAKDLSKRTPEDRTKAMLKMNELAKQLKQRRDKAGGAEEIRKKLNQMKDFMPGPADKLAKAMKQGDFKKAMQELDKLQKQMAKGQLDKKQQKQLANQMRQMQEKLQKMCDARKQAEKKLKEQIQKARDAGDKEAADQLQQKLDQLQQQNEQMQQMDQMAQQLKQCAGCMGKGQTKQAAESLKQLQGQLSQLQKQADEMEMLDEAMDQMAQCRQGMGCKQCGGQGCKACQGQGMGRPGDGLGAGQGGWGDRPEQKNDTAFRKSQVSQKVGPGSMSVVGQVDGPNKQGQVNEEIKRQFEAAKHLSSDPLTGQRMPRSHREHAKEYLDRLRKGE